MKISTICSSQEKYTAQPFAQLNIGILTHNWKKKGLPNLDASMMGRRRGRGSINKASIL